MKPRAIKKLFFVPAFSLAILLLFCYIYVTGFTYYKTHDNVIKTPFKEYTLLPGTSKYMDNGKINLFFTNRCDAAVELWNHNKTSFFIISGDSTSPAYDEAELMREELNKNGIPDSVLILDKNGFNTRASILFCKKMKIQDLTVVSQKFHNERAIVIANHYRINAIGYNAQPVYTSYGIRVWVREWFARVKLILDTIIN